MTCCARPELRRLFGVLLVALAAAALAMPTAAYKKKAPEAEELFNPLLGPDYAHWLVGPVYHMVSDKEAKEFLDLVSDEEAAAFIARFWEEQNKGTPVFTETPQQIFEKRAIEADKRWTEDAYPGRNSDRGMVFILYGEPTNTSYSNPRNVGDPTLEVWEYAKDSEPGLDGDKPKKSFRFIKIGRRTELYSGQTVRRLPNQRRRTGF